ncbi:MAG: hypothetical protein MJZ77_04645 [Bacteroidales bacterium]|nr:hypothetical protein [Bacteroidales bacterium]
MKKYVVLAAAIAMVAFASCNKEEKGFVTLTVGGEPTENTDKQVYNSALNSVMFQNSDQMFINGRLANIACLNDDDDPYTTTDGYSYRAQLSVPTGSLMGQSFLAVYPASSIDAEWMDVATDYYPVTMVENFHMIPQYKEAATNPAAEGTEFSGDYQCWPMAAFATCGECVANDGYFQLKNAVAVFSPAIMYGMDFYNALARQFSLVTVNSVENVPALVLDKVVLSSTEPLAGLGRIENVRTSEPYVFIEDEPIYSIEADNTGAIKPLPAMGLEQRFEIMGNITVPPFQHDGVLTQQVYFHMDINGQTYSFVQTSPRVNVQAASVVRGKRTILAVNMFDAVYANQVMML